MRNVIALFDAPGPALAALRGLRRAGFAAADMACVSARRLDEAEGIAARRMPIERRALTRSLERLGLDTGDARTCAEGVEDRGAILVAVACPTLSAEAAAAIVRGAAPPDLDEHRRRWRDAPAGLAEYLWDGAAAPAI